MPVKIVTGDLFTYPAPAIAHGCNCVGAFDAGVAGLVRRGFPDVAEDYEDHVKSFGEAYGETASLLGTIQVTAPARVSHTKYVVNLFTQYFGGPHARIDSIGDAIGRLVSWAEDERVPEVAIPMIGYGIGGLSDEWSDVLEAIVEAVADSLVTITIVRLP